MSGAFAFKKENFMGTKLLRAPASSLGVSSREVASLIDDMIENRCELHSVMVIRHGKVACECYKFPITADDPHMIYSISKGFISAAYCFAFSEGLLKEDDRFLDIFPDYAPEKRDPYLEKLKISDLLEMTSGKRTSRNRGDWLESFVNAEWDFEPGTDFRYVSDNYYAASAVLTKVSGESVTEYLTPRLYEPLGIDVPFWEKSPQNIEGGGWGLFLTPEDIGKFAICCQNGGRFNGKQVIPEDYLKKAMSNLHDSSRSQSEADSRAGYGRGFWQCAGVKNAVRLEGLYSQYAVLLNDYDASVILTGGEANLQKTLDILWRHIDDIFDKGDTEDVKLDIPGFSPFPVSDRRKTEMKIDGRVYKLDKKLLLDKFGYPISSISMPALFFSKDKGGDMTDISFKFDKNGFTMKWRENGGNENSHYVPLDGTFGKGEVKIGDLRFETVSTGRWLNENTLEIVIRPLSAVAAKRFVFKFKGKFLTMDSDMIPGIEERAKIIGEKLKTVLKGRYFEWWIDYLVPRIKNIIEPTHIGISV